MKYNILTNADAPNPFIPLIDSPSVICPVLDDASPPPPPWIQLNQEDFDNYISTNTANLKAHILTTAPESIAKKARLAALQLMDKFTGANIALGITQAGKTKLIADTLADVQRYMASGSLYEALKAIDLVVLAPNMDPFLNASIVARYKADIVAVLSSL